MKTKRLTWLLAAVCLAMIVVALAVWLIPCYREQAALAEFERAGVLIVRPAGSLSKFAPGGFRVVLPATIEVELRGPEWLRGLVGDGWMRPFDCVSSIELSQTHWPDFRLSSEGYRPCDLLCRLRSVDRLTVGSGQFSATELERLRTRFPNMTISEDPFWLP